MDEKDWRILKTIAGEKNVTKAAQRLFISQPALTYRIKKIEEEFGSRILTRMPGGVALTPQGECLLSYAGEMLLRLDAVKDRIRNMEREVKGALRMGSSGIFAHYLLPGLFKGFLARYPKVEVSLKTGLSFHIVDLLEKQEIMLGIVRGDPDWSGHRILLSEEPVCLVCDEPVDFDELAHRAHIRYGTDMTLRKMLDEWWRKNFNVSPRTTMDVNTMDIARQMVLHGLGWTLLPKIGLPQDDSLFVKEIRWPDGSPVVRRTWAMCSEEALALQTVRAFIEHLESWRFSPGH